MLSQIGYLSLPAELVEKIYCGERLSPDETVLAGGVPEVVNSLLENIPRLEPVIQILTALNWGDEQIARLGDDTIGLGTRILALVLEFDSLISQGLAVGDAVQTLRGRAARFGEPLIEQFSKHIGSSGSGLEMRELPLRAVRPGMTILQDVRNSHGVLLVARGFEVTTVFLERIRNYSSDLLGAPVRVLMHSAAVARPEA